MRTGIEISSEGHTFEQLWLQAVSLHGDREFLLFRHADGGVTSWTYSEFESLVSQTAGKIASHGVSRGDSIHLALRNSPAFLLIWLAASRLGAWIVSVDPASPAKDIALQIRRTSPKLGFCGKGRQSAYRDGAAGLLHNIIELSETVEDVEGPSPLLGPSFSNSPAEPRDRLAVMFTSGTTSAPKGVLLTQANYSHVGTSMAAIINLQATDRWFVTLPLFHANAQFYCFAPAIAVGGSVAMTSAFSASGWFGQAAELGVTHASLFAAPIRMILARRPQNAPKLHLKHLWYAQSLGKDHYREFTELIGCHPRQLYGMTETTAVVTADMGDIPGHEVIGTPALGRGIRLTDPVSGKEPSVGEPGVIAVRGTRGVDLFEGYLDDPETTARSFTEDIDGTWFSTGDMASCDDKGVFRFVGRIDDVIKVAGENVSLTEVEAAIAQAPGVLEVAVLARPDPIRDQVPVAFVVPRNPAEPPKSEELEAWAELHLPPQCRPREWSIIAELPRTSVGKIRRFQLKDQSTQGTAVV